MKKLILLPSFFLLLAIFAGIYSSANAQYILNGTQAVTTRNDINVTGGAVNPIVWQAAPAGYYFSSTGDAAGTLQSFSMGADSLNGNPSSANSIYIYASSITSTGGSIDLTNGAAWNSANLLLNATGAISLVGSVISYSKGTPGEVQVSNGFHTANISVEITGGSVSIDGTVSAKGGESGGNTVIVATNGDINITGDVDTVGRYNDTRYVGGNITLEASNSEIFVGGTVTANANNPVAANTRSGNLYGVAKNSITIGNINLEHFSIGSNAPDYGRRQLNAGTYVWLKNMQGFTVAGDDVSGGFLVDDPALVLLGETSLTSNVYYETGSRDSSGAALKATGFYTITDVAGGAYKLINTAGMQIDAFYDYTGNVPTTELYWHDTNLWCWDYTGADPSVAANLATVIPLKVAGTETSSNVYLHATPIWNDDSTAAFGNTISGDLSGTGGLEVQLTPGNTLILTGTNSYAGDTIVTSGTLRLGASDAFGANTSNLTIAAAGTFETQGYDVTAGTLDVAGTLDAGSGTTGTLTATGGNVTGTLTGNTNLTMDGVANTLTLASGGTFDYTGTTTITAGTLDVDGAIYDGQSVADFVVGAGATLDLADASMTLVGGGQSLQIDAAAEPATNVVAPTIPFNLSTATLQLSGTYGYTAAKIRQFYGASGLNALNMSSDTPLQITIDGTNTGSITASRLTVSTAMTLDPNQLTIRLTNFGTTETDFTVLEVASLADIETPGGQGWSTLGDLSVYNWTPAFDVPSGMTLRYEMLSGQLIGYLETADVQSDPISGTNTDATDTILAAQNATGDTKTAQDLLKVAATPEERDQITQQFTPSMALAHAAQAVQTSSQLLQTVGQQLAVPWDNGYDGGTNMLRANNGRHSCGRDINSWFQGFGYAGEQAVKDDFAGYKNSGWGVAVGLDKAFTSRSTLGLAYGYSQTALNSTPFISGSETPSSVNTNGHSLVGYALVRSSCETFFAFKAGSTWYAVDGVRRPFASDPNRIYTYATDANTWYLQATLGWQWLQRPSFSVTPKGKLAYFNYSQSAYLENRPGLAPSSVDAYSNGYTQADLLLDFQLFLSDPLTLNTSVGYRSLSGADGAVMTSAADGVSYNVNGVSAAEHQFVLDVGSVFEINRNALLTTEYNFRTGQGSYLHGGTGSLVLTF